MTGVLGFVRVQDCSAVWVWDQAEERPPRQETVWLEKARCAKMRYSFWTIDRALETEKRKSFNAVHTESLTEGEGSLRKHQKTWALLSSCHYYFMKRKNLKY